MFRGRFSHTIDTKGRVSIPSGFRAELQRRSERAPFVTQGHTTVGGCLWLYPYEDWCALEARLEGLSRDDMDVQSYKRLMMANASECPIDNQGRTLLPPHLREHAKLEREVLIAGVGERIELWNPSLFDEEQSRALAHYASISEKVAALGRE
jgi:MraZ protein